VFPVVLMHNLSKNPNFKIPWKNIRLFFDSSGTGGPFGKPKTFLETTIQSLLKTPKKLGL
jgi:hypothetical protein